MKKAALVFIMVAFMPFSAAGGNYTLYVEDQNGGAGGYEANLGLMPRETKTASLEQAPAAINNPVATAPAPVIEPMASALPQGALVLYHKTECPVEWMPVPGNQVPQGYIYCEKL